MRNALAIILVISILPSIAHPLSAQEEEETAGQIFVIREAKEFKETNVAVEAYIVEDILDATVSVRMYASRPVIQSVLFVGPKVGRMLPKTRKPLFATVEEEAPYETTKLDGMISFSKRKRTKEAKGTLAKESVKFKIPKEKIIPGKRYQLWIKVESKKEAGKFMWFKFDLENLPELISQ